MQTPGITLWRSRRDGQPRGFLRASWRENGKKVTWDTRTLDRDEAQRKAAAELSRRRAAPESTKLSPAPAPAVQPDPFAKPPTAGDVNNAFPPPTTTANGRRPIGDAITRALGAQAAAVVTAPAAPATNEESRAKAKKLYEVFGKLMSMITEGSLKRACRFAGREPEDMDDDEISLVREGWEEKGADWFGRTNIGPWGKIALGSAVAGVGMYMGGEPIDKPKPKELPPTGGANVRPERESGGGNEV